jgi:hypothetical protein
MLAAVSCKGDGGGHPERTHPVGWAAANVHGLATKLQTETDCRGCHGPTLEGAAGVSCDSCHPAGWREDCTFCHGGEEDSTGAPPRDINGAVEGISFDSHSAHVTAGTHPGYDCTTCHVKPLDVLAPGHLFDDDTPAVAEVDLADGLSDRAIYADTTCSEAYCHGSGRADDGVVSSDEGAMACDSCHPSAQTSSRWGSMSGHHLKHLSTDLGLACRDCHSTSVDASDALIGDGTHVDGSPDIAPTGAVQWNGSTCTGLCHGHTHKADEPW